MNPHILEIFNLTLQFYTIKAPDWRPYTGGFRRLGRCSLDWATAVVGEADRELTWVTFTYHSSGPIYETSAQSMELSGT